MTLPQAVYGWVVLCASALVARPSTPRERSRLYPVLTSVTWGLPRMIFASGRISRTTLQILVAAGICAVVVVTPKAQASDAQGWLRTPSS